MLIISYWIYFEDMWSEKVQKACFEMFTELHWKGGKIYCCFLKATVLEKLTYQMLYRCATILEGAVAKMEHFVSICRLKMLQAQVSSLHLHHPWFQAVYRHRLILHSLCLSPPMQELSYKQVTTNSSLYHYGLAVRIL